MLLKRSEENRSYVTVIWHDLTVDFNRHGFKQNFFSEVARFLGFSAIIPRQTFDISDKV
jgi:hypothetical protein